MYWFATDQPDEAVQASKNLALEDLPVVGAEIAWALAQISADAGHTAEAVAAADAGHTVATRALDAPHMRFNIADAEVSALLLAGQVTDALEVAERTRQQAAHLPGAAQLLGAAVAGRAALGAGDLHSACSLLGQAVEGLSESHPIGWGYRYNVPRTTALAMRGLTDEAAAALAALDNVQRRFRSLDYERSLARAWVTAAQGAASEAITLSRYLQRKEQELLGDSQQKCCVCRLPLSSVIAPARRGCVSSNRWSKGRVSAWRRGSPPLSARVTALNYPPYPEEFERMGDLTAAVDAAAHAALSYRRQDKRGSALGCSTRADALAERCGASTPALRQATESLPLSDREAEIVMLIGEGLSNRAVAERLTLSIRTVESHIYRAMMKTGTTSRDELAALMPRHGSSK